VENERTIELSVQLTAADLKELLAGSRFKYVLWLLVPLAVWNAYLFVADLANELHLLAAINLITAGLAVFAFFYVPRVRAKLALGPTLRECRRYTLSESGVHFDAELMRCDCRWNAFTRITETKRAFVLYQSMMAGIVIPKNRFSSREDIAQLRELVKANFKGRLKLCGDSKPR
jgi:hypothetical protein